MFIQPTYSDRTFFFRSTLLHWLESPLCFLCHASKQDISEADPVRAPLCSSHWSKPGTDGSGAHQITYLETLGRAECIRLLALQSLKAEVSLLKVPGLQAHLLPSSACGEGWLFVTTVMLFPHPHSLVYMHISTCSFIMFSFLSFPLDCC